MAADAVAVGRLSWRFFEEADELLKLGTVAADEREIIVNVAGLVLAHVKLRDSAAVDR